MDVSRLGTLGLKATNARGNPMRAKVDLSDGNVDAYEEILDPEQSRRLQALYDAQGDRSLSEKERLELGELVAAYGHQLHERQLRELARKRGVPLQQVREDVETQFNAALDWWQNIQADPERLNRLVEQAKQQQAAKRKTATAQAVD